MILGMWRSQMPQLQMPQLQMPQLQVPQLQMPWLQIRPLCSMCKISRGRFFLFPLLISLLGLSSSPAWADGFNQSAQGLPGRREGGATRSAACVIDARNSLTVFVPENNVGLTGSGYPRFFWFIPANNAVRAEFVLYQTNAQQTEEDLVYATEYKLSGEPGVMSLKLPQGLDLAPLQEGELYRWEVSLICSPTDNRNITVSGWVEPIELDPSLVTQLANSPGLVRAELFAQNGLWFETLETLAELRCANPQNPNLAATWVNVLSDEEVGLSHLANQTIANFCSTPLAISSP